MMKEQMSLTMNAAIKSMIANNDPEVVFMGEQIDQHKAAYLRELQSRYGLSPVQAVIAIQEYCWAACSDEDYCGPEYREDLLEAFVAAYRQYMKTQDAA